MRAELIELGHARLETRDYLGRRQDRLVPLRSADLSVFDADELDTIEHVLTELAELTAHQVSDLSHEEPGWRLTDRGETIPYASALLSLDQVSTPTSRRLVQAATERRGLAARR